MTRVNDVFTPGPGRLEVVGHVFKVSGAEVIPYTMSEIRFQPQTMKIGVTWLLFPFPLAGFLNVANAPLPGGIHKES